MPAATRISTATVMAALMVMAAAAPLSAVDQEVDGTGIVHAGYYPEPDLPGADIGALVTALGASPKRITFVGDTIDVVFDLPPDTPALLNEIWLAGATPVVNLLVGNASISEIALGTQDLALENWAEDLKLWLDEASSHSIIIAPLPEMNAAGGKPYQCQSGTFRDAYQKIVAVIDAKLGTAQERVRWAFAPSRDAGPGCGSISAYYPDPAFVDFTGVVAKTTNPGAVSPLQLLSQALADLKAIAPTKPILVTETGACVGAARSDWIAQLFDLLKNDGHVLGFVWLNQVEGCDWRIWNGTTVDAAFDAAFDGSTYRSAPISEWFVPGTTLVVKALADTPDPCPDGAGCDSVSVIQDVQGFGPTFTNYLRARLFAPRNIFPYGNPGDSPLMGDWTCDGVDTPGMYRQSDGFVYLRNSNTPGNADIRFFFGNPGDVPIPGDFNGDGCDTLSLYRPSEQRFFIINELGENEGGLGAADFAFSFGDPGDKPFSGDFDGDGIDEVGLHRESTGLVYYRETLTTGNADKQFIFGDPGDIMEAGDWNGDGIDTVAVYRPSTGVAHLKLTNQQGVADVSFFVGVGMTGLATAPRTPA